MRIYRSDQVSIHVSIAGLSLDAESWDMVEGGDIAAEEVIVFPGAMQEQIALGGISKRSPITVERLWSEAMVTAYKAMERSVVIAAAVTASYTLLGPEQASTGNVFTYTGVAAGVMRPNYKSGASEEVRLQLKISPNGPIS